MDTDTDGVGKQRREDNQNIEREVAEQLVVLQNSHYKKENKSGENVMKKDNKCRDRSRSQIKKDKKPKNKEETRRKKDMLQDQGRTIHNYTKNGEANLRSYVKGKQRLEELNHIGGEKVAKDDCLKIQEEERRHLFRCIQNDGTVAYKTMQQIAWEDYSKNEENVAEEGEKNTDEGWQTPRRTHKYSQGLRQEGQMSEERRGNRYEILQNNEEGDSMEIDRECQNNKNTENSNSRKSLKKAPFYPPFIVENLDVKLLSRDLQELGIDFVVTQLTRSKIKVQTRVYAHYLKIKELFDSIGVQYYTYTPREEKYYTLLMKGLHSSWSVEEVETEFSKIFPRIKFKAERFVTKKSQGNYLLNIFKFNIKPSKEITLDSIMSMRSFLYQVIKWERIKNRGPIQCRNCLLYGHIAVNCKQTQICVKCGVKGHGAMHCKIPKDSDPEILKCARCGGNGHPASYRGCPAYRKLIERLNEKKRGTVNRNEEKQLNFKRGTTNTVKNGVTYAAAVKGAPKRITGNANTSALKHISDNSKGDNSPCDVITEYFNESINLFGVAYDELLQLINNFNNTTRGLPLHKKQAVYLQFTMKLTGYGFRTI